VVQVQIVGQVLKVTPSATNIVFQIDDGTGQIDVRVYADQEDPNSFQARKASEIKEGFYVRVVGSLRAFGEKRSIVGFRLIPVVDSDELTHHFLEVIYVHLVNTRGGTGVGQPMQTGYGMAQPSFMQQRQPNQQTAPMAANPYQQQAKQDSGLNSLQGEVISSLLLLINCVSRNLLD